MPRVSAVACAVGGLALAAVALAAPDARFDGAKGGGPLAPAAVVPPAPGKPLPPDPLARLAESTGLQAQLRALAAKTPPEGGAFRFAVIGDAEPGRFAWERVFSPGKDAFWRLLADADALAPHFVLQLGDLVSKGTSANYESVYGRLSTRLGAPFFPVIGNHDRSRPNGEANKDGYDAVNGRTDFFFDYAGWRFVGLDTADRRLRDSQMRWLETVVPRDGRCVIFTHVPPAFLKGHLYSPPKPGFTELSEQEKKEGYIHDVLTAYFDENSDAFLRLLEERRVARVYMGHIHAFGVARRGATTFVLSGGGGSPLYPLPPGEPKRKMAHFIDVVVAGDALTETVHELDGSSYPLPSAPAGF